MQQLLGRAMGRFNEKLMKKITVIWLRIQFDSSVDKIC